MSKTIGDWWLISSGVLFGLYCLNVGLGKIALLSDSTPLFSMGDVGEFFLLFTSVMCLVVTMLQRESKLEE